MTGNGNDLTPIIHECELDQPMGHSYLLELGEALRAARNGTLHPKAHFMPFVMRSQTRGT